MTLCWRELDSNLRFPAIAASVVLVRDRMFASNSLQRRAGVSRDFALPRYRPFTTHSKVSAMLGQNRLPRRGVYYPASQAKIGGAPGHDGHGAPSLRMSAG
jgi:hypothetical protein